MTSTSTELGFVGDVKMLFAEAIAPAELELTITVEAERLRFSIGMEMFNNIQIDVRPS